MGKFFRFVFPLCAQGAEVFDLAVFSRFGGKSNLRHRPNSHRTVLRGSQNCFSGVPARKKVLGGLLKCPKTPHNHYGTLSWGPEGTLGPAKSNFFQNPNFHRFPAKFALPNARAGARSFFCDPKTRLQGSLRANKCSDAAYSVPGHHRVSMGLHLGVPWAPWVWQNQKNRDFRPFPGLGDPNPNPNPNKGIPAP